MSDLVTFTDILYVNQPLYINSKTCFYIQYRN